ncbi:MAG TPA: hypothetical protein VH643_19170 [Gemmataceae bacterium]|jgi:hypothetical protein
MKFFARLCVCVVAAIALLVGLSFFSGCWLGDRTNGFQVGRWIVFESRRSEALRHRSEAVAHGSEIKKAIVADLRAGRLTLREAAAQFREANQMVENGVPEMVADYRTPTSEEGLCRQVLAWVWAEVADLPTEQQERILAPLRKEYQSMFGHPAAEMVSPLEAKP